MKVRPILFNAAMVRALLDGSKTQTRRVSGLEVINAEPDRYEFHGVTSGPGMPHFVFHDHKSGAQVLVKCRHGQPGDRLWVRETWMPGYDHDPDAIDEIPKVSVIYRADKAEIQHPAPSYAFAEQWLRLYSEDGESPPPWKPSIFMPHWASRILLEIVSVRVERLQDISDDDAIAEGVHRDHRMWFATDAGGPAYKSPSSAYRNLWESINGPGSWDANPWVWVVEFKKVAA